MVDDEAQIIREEVIRVLEEQEAGESIPVENFIASEASQEAGAVTTASFEASEDTGEVDEAAAEREVLRAVFDDVRAQSAASALVEPARWPLVGLVPSHRTPDEWEMFVYEYVEDAAAQRAAVAAEARATVRSATRAVGVPQRLRADKEEDAGDVSPVSDSPEEEPFPEPALELEPEQQPEVSAVAITDSAASLDPACDDIVALVGQHSYYLYSNEHMTDAYARWSFLAAEDDRVLTFVECVRDESRTYPRPMGATALTNEPFNFQPAEVAELWETVRESGAHPDIDTVTASNGDVYYFSTEYLSPAYAASLAEWNSVERDMFL